MPPKASNLPNIPQLDQATLNMLLGSTTFGNTEVSNDLGLDDATVSSLMNSMLNNPQLLANLPLPITNPLGNPSSMGLTGLNLGLPGNLQLSPNLTNLGQLSPNLQLSGMPSPNLLGSQLLPNTPRQKPSPTNMTSPKKSGLQVSTNSMSSMPPSNASIGGLPPGLNLPGLQGIQLTPSLASQLANLGMDPSQLADLNPGGMASLQQQLQTSTSPLMSMSPMSFHSPGVHAAALLNGAVQASGSNGPPSPVSVGQKPQQFAQQAQQLANQSIKFGVPRANSLQQTYRRGSFAQERAAAIVRAIRGATTGTPTTTTPNPMDNYHPSENVKPPTVQDIDVVNDPLNENAADAFMNLILEIDNTEDKMMANAHKVSEQLSESTLIEKQQARQVAGKGTKRSHEELDAKDQICEKCRCKKRRLHGSEVDDIIVGGGSNICVCDLTTTSPRIDTTPADSAFHDRETSFNLSHFRMQSAGMSDDYQQLWNGYIDDVGK